MIDHQKTTNLVMYKNRFPPPPKKNAFRKELKLKLRTSQREKCLVWERVN